MNPDKPTPYAVQCPEHGQVFMDHDEYMRQLCRPDSRWECPRCGELAWWDDENYERYLPQDPPEEEM